MKKELANNKKHFTLPPEEEIKKLFQRIEQPGYRRINMGLHPNATAAEKTKYKLCKSISYYLKENNLTEKELAKKLGITHAKLEEIIFCHIDKFSLEELINYTEELSMPLEMNINGKHVWKETSPQAH